MNGDFDLIEATIFKIQKAYISKILTVQELVSSYIDRINQLDKKGPKLNSIITLNQEALKEAENLDRVFRETGKFVGPLHGIPVVVKDQINTSNIRTTYGSVAFKNYTPIRNATVINRLKSAGAIILAKTNLPDFACAFEGISSIIGQTKNPYDLNRDSGGSSSGTAVAVAANLATVGIGTDTGGSIRVPSSFNNLFGLRVTTGLISKEGIFPLVHFLDSPGPITRTVKDMAIVLDSIVGFDDKDNFTAVTANYKNLGHFSEFLNPETLKHTRIGILKSGFGTEMEESSQVNKTVMNAINILADAGAEIVENIEISNLTKYIGATSLYINQSKKDINDFLKKLDNSPVRSFEEIYEKKLFHSSLDLIYDIAKGPSEPEKEPRYFESLYTTEIFRQEILRTMARHKLDAICYPNVKILPPTLKEVEEGRWKIFTFPTNTLIASLSNLPAISMPAGFTASGIPVGLELLGKQFGELDLLNIAYSYEYFSKPRRPPKFA